MRPGMADRKPVDGRNRFSCHPVGNRVHFHGRLPEADSAWLIARMTATGRYQHECNATDASQRARTAHQPCLGSSTASRRVGSDSRNASNASPSRGTRRRIPINHTTRQRARSAGRVMGGFGRPLNSLLVSSTARYGDASDEAENVSHTILEQLVISRAISGLRIE